MSLNPVGNDLGNDDVVINIAAAAGLERPTVRQINRCRTGAPNYQPLGPPAGRTRPHLMLILNPAREVRNPKWTSLLLRLLG
jgi:hypothetical protein